MRIFCLALIAAFAGPVSISAQDAHSSEGLSCFENLPTPEYPKAALQGRIDGSVWTTTKVSAQGTIDKVETQVVSAWSEGSRLLVPPVEKAIRAAKIKPDCAGKSVSVVFRYQLYGEPTTAPKVTSRSDPPNLLWIESQPESTGTQSASR